MYIDNNQDICSLRVEQRIKEKTFLIYRGTKKESCFSWCRGGGGGCFPRAVKLRTERELPGTTGTSNQP